MFKKYLKGLRNKLNPFRSSSQVNVGVVPCKIMRLEGSSVFNLSGLHGEEYHYDENMEVDIEGSTQFVTTEGQLIATSNWNGPSSMDFASASSISEGQEHGATASASGRSTPAWELYIRHNNKMRNRISYPVREDLRLMGEEANNPKFPPTSIVSECMENTFTIRDKDLSSHGISPRNAIELYPGLKDYDELRKEFERVVGKDVNKFERKIHTMLQKYCYGALALKNKLCYAHRECYDARRILETKQEEEDQKLSASFILFCCSETGGKWVDVFQKEHGARQFGAMMVSQVADETPYAYSHLFVKGNVFADYSSYVYLQDKKIMTPPKFHQAFLSCFYLNIVLHIELQDEVMLQMFKPLWQLLMSTPDLKKEIYKLINE